MRERNGARSYPVVVAVLLLAIDPGLPAADLPDLIEEARPGVVAVLGYNPDKAMPGIGTGFLVSPDLVITARHVLAGCDRADVRTCGGQTVRVEGIAAEDRLRDLAALRLERAPAGTRVLPVAPADPRAGEPVFAISCPLGLEGSASSGIVASVRELTEAGRAIQHTAAVSSGSSGCPILDLHGRVVAVQTATITTSDRVVSAGQSLNFAAPASRVAALRPDRTRTLASLRDEVPATWIPAITSNVDIASLRPITREDFGAALAFFEEAVRQGPEEADAWFRLGICREKIGRNEDAAGAYRKAVSLRPEFPICLNNLGVTCLRQGKDREACEALEKAVALRPDYPEAQASLATALNRLDRRREAADAARKALKSNPAHAEAHFQLGVALLEGGEREKAIEEHAALLELDRGLADRLKAMIDGKLSDAGPDVGRSVKKNAS